MRKKTTDYKYRGVDLSYAQGAVNWNQLRNQIDFAMLRIGYGKENIDSCYLANVENAYQNGIHWGGYYFSYALSPDDARAEADSCIKIMRKGGYSPDMPIAYDFEYASSNYFKRETGRDITNSEMSEIIIAFCKRMEECGFYVMVYVNNDYYKRLDNTIQINYALWYAYYNQESNRSLIQMWQYTSSGQLAGINGCVDLNLCDLNFPLIIHQNGLNRIKS